MKSNKKKFRKGTAILLACTMMVGSVAVMPGSVISVKAASGNEPSVSAYATKTELMDDTFAPKYDEHGQVNGNIGKLVFGRNGSGTAQEWYILGSDEGVSGDNTVIFATSPIVGGQVFEDDATNDKNYVTSWDCTYPDDKEIIQVYPNHYGASDLRAALQGMVNNTTYFTDDEKIMMNATTVTTYDGKNKCNYTTTDKLYALTVIDSEIVVGSGDSKKLSHKYWYSSDEGFWLRTCDSYGYKDYVSYVAPDRYGVDRYTVEGGNFIKVRPASNLDLSDVLFASAATAASSDTEVSGTIVDGTAMTLRLKGSSETIGTVTYNTATGDIKATKSTTGTTGDVALVVQGNDGTNDWYYSKQITGTETVNASDIKTTLGLSTDIDLSACKIWLETTDTDERMIYAVEGELVVGHTHSGTEVKKEAATCTKDGNIAYYVCDCGMMFSDSGCTTEVTEVKIEALGHDWSGEWVVTKKPTATEDGIEETACTHGCGEKKQRTIPATGATHEEDPDAGKLEKEADVEKDAPIEEAALDNKEAELLEAEGIITPEERAEVMGGKSVKVWLEISKTVENKISDTDKASVLQAAEQVLGDDAKLVYFDVDLYKQMEGGEKTKITEPGMNIQVTVKIPDTLLNHDKTILREYKIIRLHNGEATTISGKFDAETRKFSFETDKFSTYAIAYSDTQLVTDSPSTDSSKTDSPSTDSPSTDSPSTDSPKTGDDSNPKFWTLLMLMSMTALAGLFAKKRKTERHDER